MDGKKGKIDGRKIKATFVTDKTTWTALRKMALDEDKTYSDMLNELILEKIRRRGR